MWGNVSGTKGLHPAGSHSCLSQPRCWKQAGILASAQALDPMSFGHWEQSLPKGKAHFKYEWGIPISGLGTYISLFWNNLKGWIYFLFFHRRKPNLKSVHDEMPTPLANGNVSTLYQQRVLSSWVLILPNLGVQVSRLFPASPPRPAMPLARLHPARSPS